MTYEKFIEYISNPDISPSKESEKELNELIKKYPYFHIANWAYLKLLKQSDSIYYQKQLPKTALHTSDRHRLYYYVHPEELMSESRERMENNSGSYFDMVEKIKQDRAKSETTESSLKSLAQKLKEAREKTMMEAKKKETEEKESRKLNEQKVVVTPVVENVSNEDKSDEQLVKMYIQQQRYSEAIELLEKLKNLNNSKKSVYFADQIRFLKKIIEN